jgi:hypothetical protein
MKLVVLLLSLTTFSALATSRTNMNNYIDQYGRYHHKPVTEVNPIPSNNGWIYTAYAHKVGLPVDFSKLEDCYNVSKETGKLIRSPGKPYPPISRDEILGLAELGLLSEADIPDWNFSPYELPKFSLKALIEQLWYMRPEFSIEFNKDAKFFFNWWLSFRHRNFFWQNNLDQIYRFAFSVPLTDRHFILQKWGRFNIFYWAIAKVDSMLGKASGIRYLKYGKNKEAMKLEFPADHPIQGK